ncbi:MAG: hypothetical protein WC503_00905 [Candidatus Shapirobacteria bacterium]
MKKVKLKVTITFEFDANPKYYGTDVPAEMAKIDQEQFYENPDILSEMIITDEYMVKVEPIE